MAPALTISEAGEGQATELATFSSEAYVSAFGADFADPADLDSHLQRTLSPQAWRSYLASDLVFTARDGDVLVGFLQIGPAEPAGDRELRRLYVDPPRLNRGIGALLMQHALHAVRSAPSVRLDVWHDNLRAQRFYARFGFEFTGERRPFVLSSGKVDGYDLVMVRRGKAPA